jgi:hypothetical protein
VCARRLITVHSTSAGSVSLAWYFARILCVFFVMWMPAMVLMFAINIENPWTAWAGGSWGHLQGVCSALLALKKLDVYEAVVALICCCSHSRASYAIEPELSVPARVWPELQERSVVELSVERSVLERVDGKPRCAWSAGEGEHHAQGS